MAPTVDGLFGPGARGFGVVGPPRVPVDWGVFKAQLLMDDEYKMTGEVVWMMSSSLGIKAPID